MKRIAAISASILLLIGCGRYFAPDIRIKRPVAAAEVAGTWVLRGDCLTVAKQDHFHPYHEQSGHAHEIEIRADGTCRFRSITQMPTDYLDCEGTWRLGHSSKDKDAPQLDLLLQRNGVYGFSMDFTEENGHLVLWEYWGDPDEWQFLKYDKQPNPQGGANGRQPPSSDPNQTPVAAVPRHSP